MPRLAPALRRARPGVTKLADHDFRKWVYSELHAEAVCAVERGIASKVVLLCDEAEAKRWLNFGTLDFDRDGRLTAKIVNTAGQTQFSVTVTPSS